jgi:hypothetical protein
VALERTRHLIEQGSGGEEELDQCLGAVAERRMVDDGSEALERAALAQAVDAALDGGSGQGDVVADVVVRAPAVFDEQRKDLSIGRVYTVIYCTNSVFIGIDS